MDEEETRKKLKKRLIIASVLVFVIASVLAVLILRQLSGKPVAKKPVARKSVETTKEAEPPPILYTCPLDGTTSTAIPNRPLAIMIDNIVRARPHFGIDQACLVIEALAEGGITRLEAFYSCNLPKVVGPVRSARTYYVEYAQGFNALYAHVGGSPQALRLLRNLAIDLDEFRYSEAYWRIPERRRPHNMLTSPTKLYYVAEKKGLETKWTGDPFYLFKDDEPLQNRGFVKSITIKFSTRPYEVQYIYDRMSNLYARYLYNKPYVTADSKVHIKTKNVIVIYTSTRVIDYKARLEMPTTGTGKALVFRDGIKIEGTWKRAKVTDPLKLFDSTGSEIQLNRGGAWIAVVNSKTPVIIAEETTQKSK